MKILIKTDIALLLALMPLAAAAQPKADGLKTKMVYEQLMYIDNIQSGSHNPTAISMQPLSISGFTARFGMENGSFRTPDDAGKIRAGSLGLFGTQHFGRTSFEGSFDYANSNEKERTWHNSVMLSEDNPFFVASPVLSTYSIERYALDGGVSHEFTQRWRAGLRANYTVSNSSTEYNPRSDTRALRFRLNPGVDFRTGDFTLGLSGHAGWFRERVEFVGLRTTSDNDHVYFWKSLGDPVKQPLYTSEGMPYPRRYSGNDYSGNFQFTVVKPRLANFFSVGYLYRNEKNNDGESYFESESGEFQAETVSFRDRLRLNGRCMVHNITLDAAFGTGEGIWSTQVEVPDPEGVKYETRDRKVIHRQKRMLLSGRYRMDLLRSGVPHMMWSVGGGYLTSDTKYHFEGYRQKYSNLILDVNIAKHFDVGGSCVLSVALDGRWQNNLDREIDVEGTRFAAEYKMPMYEYLTADYYAAGLELSFRFPVRMFGVQSVFDVFARGRYASYDGDYKAFDDRKGFTAGIKLLF